MPIFAICAIEAIIIIASCAVIGYFVISNYKKNQETTIGNAEDKAREIIDEALKAAETKKREGLLEIKRNRLRQRTNLIRRSKSAGQKHSAMREGFSRRKKALIRRLSLSKRKK